MRPHAQTLLFTACLFFVTAGFVSGANAQGIERVFERLLDRSPPLAKEAGPVFDGHQVGGLSLQEFLYSLDFVDCLTDARTDLVAGLDRLRAIHVGSQEARGIPATWRAWRPFLDGLSPDATILVSTWLDSPEVAQRLYFCEDGLPASWRGLSPEAFVVEAITWFDIEVAEREHALQRGHAGDREQAVMHLMELRDTLLGRYATTFATASADKPARLLEDRLALMWSTLVEPYHYGFTPKARATTPVADQGVSRYSPVSPFKEGGIGIPDPRDVALRDRVARGWRRQRATLRRELKDRQERLDLAIVALDEASGTEELNQRMREAMRIDAELAQSVADLERLQARVRSLQTGKPWVDDMLSNGFRRRAVRRLDRSEVAVLRQRDAVRQSMSSAVARGAIDPEQMMSGTAPLPSGAPGQAPQLDAGEPGPGNWLAGLETGSLDAGNRADRAEGIPEGTGWVQRTYEGPLPPPSKVWSQDLVGAILTRHPRLDEADVRILLGLVRATYSEITGRAAIEDAVWRTLATSEGLRLGGEETTLSELYLPGETRAEQPIITFVLTLNF